MMRLGTELKLYRLWTKAQAIAKEKEMTSGKITQIVALLVQAIGLTGASVFATQWLTSHLIVIAVSNGILAIGHALAPSLLGDTQITVPASSGSSTAKLSAWMLISVLLMGTMAGCTAATVAQDIVNWTPTLQSAVGAVDSTAAVLDPAAAPIFVAATAGFDAASNVLAAQAKAYLANPNAGVLAQLQTAVTTFQQQVNAALLQAAHITNPASQQKALTDINAVGVIVNTILSLVLTISSKAAVAQMAKASAIKLAAVEPYVNRGLAARMVADHYSESRLVAGLDVNGAMGDLQRAGF